MRIQDTMTREVVPVTPSDGHALRFYCCGPTVYGPAHIGNFRTFLVQDLFRRVAELEGMRVHHVRNLTDVDDKTIRVSRQEGLSLGEFTARWTERFHRDADALGLLPPAEEPGAVAHIPDQIALIQRLFDQGLAYHSEDGSVYFDVSAYPSYGRLSRVEGRSLQAGASGRAGHAADEYERDSVADFVLWKARKEEDGDNHWESPWGPGRPGWHLECSAMSLRYLGSGIDVHSGGMDLCFPHHENEIAQSEGATGEPFVRTWFHSALLLVDGRKMSKSLGNLYTVDDVREMGFAPRELRYALLAGHYRQPLNFTRKSLEDARSALGRIDAVERALAERAGQPLDPGPGAFAGSDPAPLASAWEALRDDLNAPRALGALFTELGGWESALREDRSLDAGAFLHALRFVRHAFGWGAPGSAPEVKTAPPSVRDLAERRWEAKKRKDFATADALRDSIAAEGWSVEDKRDGYELVPAS